MEKVLEQNNTSKGNSIYKILFFGLVFLILVSGVAYGAYYLGKKQVKNVVVNEETVVLTPALTEIAVTYDSQIVFLAAPLKVPGMGIMKNLIDAQIIEENPGFQLPKNFDIEANSDYYKIGTIKDPTYKDGELYLINVKNLPEMFGGTHQGMVRFIKYQAKIVILTSNSDIFMTSDKKQVPENFVIDNKFILSGLKVDNEFVFNYKGQNLIFTGWNAYFGLPVTTDKIGNISGKDFLEESRKQADKPIFRTLGEPRRFYLKVPDGTYQEYSLDDRYISKIPQKYDVVNANPPQFIDVPNDFKIIWTDGASLKSDPNTGGGINYSQYDAKLAGLTGSKISYYDLPIDLNNDLVKIGSNPAGEEFFALKNKNHIIYTDFYKNRNDYSDFTKKMTLEEFVANRPVFFWKDLFGDYHAEFRGDFEVAAGIAKPAVYLYPNEETEVGVKIDSSLNNVFTIPEYNEGWNVKAFPDGKILFGGKTFDYLFYEGDKKYFDFELNNFDVVKKQNINKYLEDKLLSLGLNKKERQQFIEYWEPKMRESNFYKIGFMTTSELSQKIPLFINPKPDTLIRILMKFEGESTGVEKISIINNPPARLGFTAVEWGGVR